ncbi:MAG: hypothetical protein BMS9Abin07_2131 [Acidimicrobiia bacterium]|nr:MAG: hypothetical protein BMS9Abin07_2131 [Acidimicrobiia bacterium]
MEVRLDFVDSLSVLRSLIGAVVERWQEPSALEGMTVGALASHACRAAFTTERYLAAPAPAGGDTVDAAGYFLAIPDLTGPIDSDVHRSVRARADDEAAAGPEDLLARFDRSVEVLMVSLPSEKPERVLEVFGGIAMRLDDYLITRLVEVVVHSDDLAASLDLAEPAFSDSVNDRVIRCLVEVAVRSHGRLAVIRALTRRERDAVAALRVL